MIEIPAARKALVLVIVLVVLGGGCSESGDIAEYQPSEEVLRVKAELEGGSWSFVEHGFGGVTEEGGQEYFLAGGVYIPDPRTPIGEDMIRRTARSEGLSESDTELLLRLIEGDRTGPPGRGEHIYDYQRTGEIRDQASGGGSGDPVSPKVASTGEKPGR